MYKNYFNPIVILAVISVFTLTTISSVSFESLAFNCVQDQETLIVDCESENFNSNCEQKSDTAQNSDENLFSFLDFLTPTAHAASKYHPEKTNNPDPLSPEQCKLYIKYRPWIVEALKKYQSRSFAIIAPSIVGAILYEESGIGIGSDMKPKGCAGRSDYRKKGKYAPYGAGYYGHGLGQADPSSGDGPKSVNWPVGAKVKLEFHGSVDNYVWSDCRDGIFYSVGHTLKLAEAAEPIILNKLKRAGLNTARFDNGIFKDPKVQKAYTYLQIDAHNAGPTGMKDRCFVDRFAEVDEGCTENKHYGERVIKSSINIAKCYGNKITMEEQLNRLWAGD
jgi:hypothetical protein